MTRLESVYCHEGFYRRAASNACQAPCAASSQQPASLMPCAGVALCRARGVRCEEEAGRAGGAAGHGQPGAGRQGAW